MSGVAEFWPARASVYAGHVDALMWGFTAVVVLLSAPVFVLTLVFAIRYRRGRPANRDHVLTRSTWIEVSWAVAPFLLTVGFFIYAAALFLGAHRAPADALTIEVVGRQWMWKFQHPGGQREINDLHVPAGQSVLLVMTSQDVIHSLYLPSLRLKQDVLPGRYTSVSFVADRPGVYRILCSQFCGLDHSGMVGRLFVQPPADYARWLQTSAGGGDLAAQGAAVYRRLGCGGCHDRGGVVRAPDLAGLYGSPVPLSDGRTVRADRQYLHDSLVLPNRDVVAGYAPVMPTYAGQIAEDELTAIDAYLQVLGRQPGAAR